MAGEGRDGLRLVFLLVVLMFEVLLLLLLLKASFLRIRMGLFMTLLSPLLNVLSLFMVAACMSGQCLSVKEIDS